MTERLPTRPLTAPLSFVARGSSMSPLLPDGTAVLVEPMKDRPRLGEVLLVMGAHGPALHRVIGLNGDRTLLGGDTCLRPDGFTEPEHILGRCTLALRKGRPLPLTGPLVRAMGLAVAGLLRLRRRLIR